MQETLTTLYDSVKKHIRAQYEGIFSEAGIERHFFDYVELELSEVQFAEVRQAAGLHPGQRLMDLGCGFGSFVLVCRKNGVMACGVDVAEFDIDFARKRLALTMPETDAQAAYFLRPAEATQMESGSFDMVTAWNLLEHVPDFNLVIREAYRLLKPGGVFIGVAPNYAAFRREAHYLVPWLPLFPRGLASLYLRLLGRTPDFFEKHIYYVTNWGILNGLKKEGFTLEYPDLLKTDHPETVKSSAVRKLIQLLDALHLKLLFKTLLFFSYWNPLKTAIPFMARKSHE
jgi:2-polyprenyl-3-methyl-5-hydroxy-6-metoxy-1,4-benzoquinol methylase